MELTKKIRQSIAGLEERELYKYIAIALLLLLATIAGLFYIHRRKIIRYSTELEEINRQRSRAKRLLAESRTVDQQRAKIEQILAADPHFIIAKKYKDIIQSLGLTTYAQEPKRTTGETVSGKTESILEAQLNTVTMKQLTDLLSALADVAQIYPKDLTIKKPTPDAPTVDVTLKIATLEPALSSS